MDDARLSQNFEIRSKIYIELVMLWGSNVRELEKGMIDIYQTQAYLFNISKVRGIPLPLVAYNGPIQDAPVAHDKDILGRTEKIPVTYKTFLTDD